MHDLVFLRMLDHEVAVVVKDDEFDRQVMVRHGLQLLQVHHHAAIAVQAKDFTSIAGKGSAHSRR